MNRINPQDKRPAVRQGEYFAETCRPDPVRASIMIGILLGCLPWLLQFEAIKHLEALGPKFRPPCHGRRRDMASRRNPANFATHSDDPVHITDVSAMHFLKKR